MAKKVPKKSDSRPKSPLPDSCDETSLRQAAMLVRRFAHNLDVTHSECSGCGHMRYVDFEQFNAQKELLAAANKIETWADEFTKRTRPCAAKEDLHGSSR